MSEFSDNKSASRFEFQVDGAIAFANYRGDANRLALTHFETPEQLRGRGIAGHLMQAIVTHARAHAIRLVPRCPYAVDWFAKHAEARDVLAA